MTVTVPSIEDLAKQAVEIALEHGSHGNTFFIFQEKFVSIMSLEALPRFAVSRQAALRAIAKKQSAKNKKHGALTDVFLVSEAWMVVTTPERETLEPRPSEHPDRIEILVVVHKNVASGKVDSVIFEMIRSGNLLDLKRLDEDSESPTVFESYLLDSFVAGWG